MNKKEIIEIYKVISAMYEKYLKKYGVKPINLYDKNNNYTKDALTLIYLAKDYPNSKGLEGFICPACNFVISFFLI